MLYRYTNTPSLIQIDCTEDEAFCFKCRRVMPCDFHHIMNGSKYSRQLSEEIGAWVWLCPVCHRWLHGTGDGVRYNGRLKELAQQVYEQDHSRREWMEMFHKNYLEE